MYFLFTECIVRILEQPEITFMHIVKRLVLDVLYKKRTLYVETTPVRPSVCDLMSAPKPFIAFS